MTNKEKNLALEKELSRKKRKRMIIWSALDLIFLSLLITFFILYASSKQVEIIGGFIFYYEFVTYNYDYLFIALWLLFPTVILFVITLADLIGSQYRSIKIEGDYILVAIQFSCYVYLNGECKYKSLRTKFEKPEYFITLPSGIKDHINFNYYSDIATITYSKDLIKKVL